MAFVRRIDWRVGGWNRRVLFSIVAASAAALFGSTWTGVAAAAEATKYGNALDWVPADAAHFSTHLRLKEQVDIVLASKAWAKLKSQPWAQQLAGQVELMMAFQPNIQQGLAQPENQQLVAMLGDLASHEISYYIDQHTVDALTLAMQVANRASTRYSATPGADPGQAEPSTEMQHEMLKFLDANRDKLVTPTMVMAFKHTDAERVKTQLGAA